MISPNARIEDGCNIGEGTNVWDFSHIRENVVIGTRCNVGEFVYIGPGVQVGDRCKIQSRALIYEPAVIEDEVFVGPGVILTNDRHPRSTTKNGNLKSNDDWSSLGVRLRKGSSIGAGSVVIAGVEVGQWALIGAGSVITKDVQSFELVAGNPARRIGWVGRSGQRLIAVNDHVFVCPETGEKYQLGKTGMQVQN